MCKIKGDKDRDKEKDGDGYRDRSGDREDDREHYYMRLNLSWAKCTNTDPKYGR